MKFEIIPAPDGNFMWRFVDGNDRVLARSQGTYKNKSNAKRSIQTMQNWAHRALIVDNPVELAS